MEKLTIDTFIGGAQDIETKQYRVLHCLKGYYDEFSHNRLYPGFKDLIDVTSTVETLVQQKEGMEGSFPQQLTGVDIEHQKLIYDSAVPDTAGFERAVELMLWALPHLKKALNEAISIYHFVDEHIVIEEVGILPVYRYEGYWTVPDTKSRRLYLLRYEVSLFSSASERYRQLKTTVLESMELSDIHKSPETLKLEVIEKYHDLPNPAMYVCETDLDFPYEATLLPIAKRKLMTQLNA
ncbi:MAG: hypothetical protein AAB393_01480 [Bacteroidota bacterium]